MYKHIHGPILIALLIKPLPVRGLILIDNPSSNTSKEVWLHRKVKPLAQGEVSWQNLPNTSALLFWLEIVLAEYILHEWKGELHPEEQELQQTSSAKKVVLDPPSTEQTRVNHSNDITGNK